MSADRNPFIIKIGDMNRRFRRRASRKPSFFIIAFSYIGIFNTAIFLRNFDFPQIKTLSSSSFRTALYSFSPTIDS